MSGKDKISEMANLFTALSDPTRLRLLNLMREDEICVCFFTEALGESQPKISRHLAYLRKSGLVETRRDGKWMHYRIKEPEDSFAREILYKTLDWLETQGEMQEEYETLIDACCSVRNVPVTIAKAPKPEKIVESNTEPLAREELDTFLL